MIYAVSEHRRIVHRMAMGAGIPRILYAEREVLNRDRRLFPAFLDPD